MLTASLSAPALDFGAGHHQCCFETAEVGDQPARAAMGTRSTDAS